MPHRCGIRLQNSDWAWSEKVCTKNRSKYTERRTNLQSGWLVRECNDATTFDWSNVDYGYYIAEARKLIIA